MGGLRRICKALGGMRVVGNDGRAINYVWDYVADKPIPDTEMSVGSDRWKASERARWGVPAVGQGAGK
jgi:hypothetical protein